MGFLNFIIVIAPVVICIVYFKHEWDKIQEELHDEFADDPSVSSEKIEPQKTSILSYDEWKSRFEKALHGLKNQVSEKGSTDEENLKKLLNDFSPKLIKKLLKKGYEGLKTVTENGEIQSLMVKQENLTVYLVTIPGLHDHPNLLRRYPPFRFGWAKHFLSVSEAIYSENEEQFPFIQLTTFLSPNNKDGLIYVGAMNNGELFLPERLILKNLAFGHKKLIKLGYTQSF
ncbi:MAG: hypothetical protein AAFZ15_28100 [Bacteroidota bacterium]